MRQKTVFVSLGIAFTLILAGRTFTLGQEMPQIKSEIQTEPDIQWLWGEALSVDAQKNEIVVKYLDYETEQEKEATVILDDKTTYENIKSLSEIKIKDTLSIDYVVSPEGKNIAKNISIEKPEPPAETQGKGASSTETVPSDLEPAGTAQ